MGGNTGAERVDTVIIGGGQAGLATGRELARRGGSFVILDASERIGDAWRTRWESLRLFTPAKYDGLPGWRFPAPGWSFPTKDEMADYLEAYAARFELPVRTGVRVDRLSRDGERFVVSAGARRFEADRVVVASGAHRQPRVPDFASELDPGCSSSAPATRGPRSPASSHARGRRCWRGSPSARFPSDTAAAPPASSCRSSASSASTC